MYQFPVAIPGLLPEVGEFPSDLGAHDGMEGGKEPLPGGKDPACARGCLHRAPIRGPGVAQEGCRDNTDPDGEEGNFPLISVIQGKVLSR